MKSDQKAEPIADPPRLPRAIPLRGVLLSPGRVRSTWDDPSDQPLLHRVSSPFSLTVGWLPRKEVIQPQLPLRLPCYDFVPITRPTLDASPACALGQRLQVLPAFMT